MSNDGVLRDVLDVYHDFDLVLRYWWTTGDQRANLMTETNNLNCENGANWHNWACGAKGRKQPRAHISCLACFRRTRRRFASLRYSAGWGNLVLQIAPLQSEKQQGKMRCIRDCAPCTISQAHFSYASDIFIRLSVWKEFCFLDLRCS